MLVFSLQSHPDYPLIVAANRDEYYARPTSAARYWNDRPNVFAGRDLKRQGTWLGVTAEGRFAALTNLRDPALHRADAKSRGQLVNDFLTGVQTAENYLSAVADVAGSYNHFNIVLGDRRQLHYFSSRNGDNKTLSPGIYGISNYFLDTPWPKLIQAKLRFRQAIAGAAPSVSALFQLLSDASQAPDEQLPDTGVGIERERMLSSIFIASADYGTRASTIVLFHRQGGIHFYERSFAENGKFLGEVSEMIA